MHESLWRVAAVAVPMVVFAAVGVACALNPDKFVPTGLNRGDLSRRVNRFEFRMLGVVFTLAALYVLFHLLRG